MTPQQSAAEGDQRLRQFQDRERKLREDRVAAARTRLRAVQAVAQAEQEADAQAEQELAGLLRMPWMKG